MFDQLTDNTRKAMAHSRIAALDFRHDYIGPEHMLLGLLYLRTCAALDLLDDLGVDPDDLRTDLAEHVEPGTTMAITGHLPFTSGGRSVLEYALEEASTRGHDSIGTIHLLLGLIREGGLASASLARFEVTCDAVRPSPRIKGAAGDADTRRSAKPPSGFRRMAKLEHRVETLEHRIAELEKRVGEDR